MIRLNDIESQSFIVRDPTPKAGAAITSRAIKIAMGSLLLVAVIYCSYQPKPASPQYTASLVSKITPPDICDQLRSSRGLTDNHVFVDLCKRALKGYYCDEQRFGNRNETLCSLATENSNYFKDALVTTTRTDDYLWCTLGEMESQPQFDHVSVFCPEISEEEYNSPELECLDDTKPLAIEYVDDQPSTHRVCFNLLRSQKKPHTPILNLYWFIIF